MLASAGFFATRIYCGMFFLVTTLYAFLAYIPFTREAVIRAKLLAITPFFAKYHLLLFLLAAIPAGASAWRGARERKTPELVLMGGMAAAALLYAAVPLSGLLESRYAGLSLLHAFFAPVPLVLLGARDWLATRLPPDDFQDDSEEARVFFACMASGIALFLLSGLTLASVAAHLILFIALYLLLRLIRAAGSAFPSPAAQATSLLLAAAALASTAIANIVFAKVQFTGAAALALAAVTGSAVVLFVSGTNAAWTRFPPNAAGPRSSTLGFFLVPALRAGAASSAIDAIPALILFLALLALRPIAARMDWNFMAQKLLTLGIWHAALSFFYRIAPARKLAQVPRFVFLLVALLAIPLTRAAVERRRIGFLSASHDVSYRLASSLLHAAVGSPRNENTDFYAFLRSNSNLPDSARTDPPPVDFMMGPKARNAFNPDIYVIVVDSLRKDYVGAYNPKVRFTPEIDRFAAESLVFRNAYTRYGATGLSEPSFWSGVMLPHKMYVKPFDPVNTLQSLLEAEGYQMYVGLGSILSQILRPSPLIVELDRGRTMQDHELCHTLEELRTKIEAREHPEQPLFLYTQPQNLHESNVARAAKSDSGADPAMAGFYVPYASRVREVDRCFGDFLQFLKTRGLYERSVVVLASDHGDSLGEEGRFGHAYTIFPEILRIPFIIHLPQAFSEQLAADTKSPAFPIDLSPTLHFLLGYAPGRASPLFGRTLLAARGAPPPRSTWPEETFLVASSYGPVFGILGEGGESLYISDAVEFTDRFYSFAGGKTEEIRVTPRHRKHFQEAIRAGIIEINRFYRIEKTP